MRAPNQGTSCVSVYACAQSRLQMTPAMLVAPTPLKPILRHMSTPRHLVSYLHSFTRHTIIITIRHVCILYVDKIASQTNTHQYLYPTYALVFYRMSRKINGRKKKAGKLQLLVAWHNIGTPVAC